MAWGWYSVTMRIGDILRWPFCAAREHPLLTAAPGMSIRDIAHLSTARFKLPREDDDRGTAQPRGPCRVAIHHPQHGFEVPAGEFTIVDFVKGIATQVTATPQLDYSTVEQTVALLRLITDRITEAGWQPIETPIFEVLATELPKHQGRLHLGEWKLGSWTAELRVHQHLEAGSESAKIVGMPDGGFLTTLVVWDKELM
jgi:hypothetical protein